MTDLNLSRREAFAAIGTAGALASLPGCASTIVAATPRPATEAEASALLDSIADQQLSVAIRGYPGNGFFWLIGHHWTPLDTIGHHWTPLDTIGHHCTELHQIAPNCTKLQ